MALRITPDMMVEAYNFLKTTPPFSGWKLPDSDEVGFHVVPDPNTSADFVIEGDNSMHIRVSSAIPIHANTLLMLVAHELIHMYQSMHKLAKNKSALMHNADFKRRAKRICAVHGWDESLF